MPLSLRAKLLTAGGLLTAIPLTLVLVTVYLQNRSIIQTTEGLSAQLADEELRLIVQNVYALAESHQRVTEESLRHALRVARHLLEEHGGLRQGDQWATWKAVDQYSKEVLQVELPRLELGGQWLGEVADATSRVPVVDDVRDLLGVTCTVFQRMNSRGDMLRVATNVLGDDGTRAIGTFLPRQKPDGTADPVLSTVLDGRIYNGRAYVVNDWYITAYEPLYDAGRNIIGLLYVGVPQRYLTDLRQAVANITIFRSGRAFVLDSDGRYVIAPDPAVEGQLMVESTGLDPAEVQQMVRQVQALDRGEVASVTYTSRDRPGQGGRPWEARLMFFQPWGWLIAAGAPQHEIREAPLRIGAIGRRGNVILLAVFGVGLLATLLTWLRISRQIARPVELAKRDLERTVRQLERRTNEIVQLNEMGDILQACATEEETYQVVISTCRRLFPDDAGALCITNEEHRTLQVMESWGGAYQRHEEFHIERCWAMRRGKVHVVSDPSLEAPCHHLDPTPTGGYLCAPMVAQGEVLGMMFLALGRGSEPRDPGERRRILNNRTIAVRSILEHYAPCLTNLRLRATLAKESICDPLTGLYNRRHMEASLTRELHRAQRAGTCIAVIMLDLDHFKRFNDAYGHDAGDDLLRQLGALLASQARQEDIVCRSGGEEFLLIMPGIDGDAASARAQEILEVLRRDLALEVAGERHPVTASMGLALYPAHGRTLASLIKAADTALYAAKARGRDQLAVAERQPTAGRESDAR